MRLFEGVPDPTLSDAVVEEGEEDGPVVYHRKDE